MHFKANERQYSPSSVQFPLLNILLLIYTKFFSSLFQIFSYNDETPSRIKVCNIDNRILPNMLPVTYNVYIEKYEQLWLI